MQQLKRFAHAPRWMRRMQGLSMVELLISLVLGLLVVAAGGTIAVATITSSRRGMVEARLEQDVRSALSVIERELRRAGYWSNAVKNPSATPVVTNPYGNVKITNSNQVDYSYSSKILDDVQNDDEKFSIRLHTESGGSLLQIRRDQKKEWEALTDIDTVKITEFSVDSDLSSPLKPGGCSVPALGTCLRVYRIRLTGVSVADPGLRKQLTAVVRLRND